MNKDFAVGINILFFALIILLLAYLLFLLRGNKSEVYAQNSIFNCGDSCGQSRAWIEDKGWLAESGLGQWGVDYVDALAVRRASQHEAHPGELMEIINYQTWQFYRYPYVEGDNAWHRINDWIAKTAPDEIKNADHIDALAIWYVESGEVSGYGGEMVESILHGSDMYYRYTFHPTDNDWHKISDWTEFIPSTGGFISKVDAYDVRRGTEYDKYPGALQEVVIVGSRAWQRYPYVTGESEYFQEIKGIDDVNWLEAIGLSDKINGLSAFASNIQKDGEGFSGYDGQLKEILFDKSAHEFYHRYPFTPGCSNDMECYCDDGSYLCPAKVQYCRNPECPQDLNCDCNIESTATPTIHPFAFLRDINKDWKINSLDITEVLRIYGSTCF